MHIFCDLDGVQVDFEGGFLRNFGFPHDSISEPEMWKYIMSHDRHWHDLPMMPDAQALWDFIAPYNPTILTGCPKSGYDQADAGKREWCKTMLGPDVPVITCLSRNKPQYMIQPGDILIDDLVRNCKRWTEAGGQAVRHTSTTSTIAQLKKLLGV
jgi:hypothetical protein